MAQLRYRKNHPGSRKYPNLAPLAELPHVAGTLVANEDGDVSSPELTAAYVAAYKEANR